MGNLSVNNGGIATNKGGMPSIDLRYGPYESVAAAYAQLGPDGDDVVTPGLTVGIISGSTVAEYWFNGGVTLAHLVPKQSGGSGGGSAAAVSEVQHSGASPASFEVNGGEYHTFSDPLTSLNFTIGSDRPFEESYLEFTTASNWSGAPVWPNSPRFAPQEPVLVPDTTYLISIVHGIIACTEVVSQ